MTTHKRAWTVDVIELPPPVQGERRSARHTHRVIAVDKTRERVVNRTMTADEVETFDPELHWRGVLAARRQR